MMIPVAKAEIRVYVPQATGRAMAAVVRKFDPAIIDDDAKYETVEEACKRLEAAARAVDHGMPYTVTVRITPAEFQRMSGTETPKDRK